MAKKDPKDLPVEDKLKTLYQLQTVLSQIDEKRALRGELPLEVQDLEDEIAGITTRIDRIEKEILEFNEAVNNKRNEIAAAQESVEKYNAQLDEVQNNRQYDTLTKEIEYQGLQIELCNKKIKEALTKVAELKTSLNDNRNLMADRQADLETKRSELDDIVQETREAEAKLKEKAAELETKIEPRLLQSFKRIRKNARNGLGIVAVQRDACGGCFNKIPPQRQLDIKMHKKIIVCEYCGRIMVDPELAGIKEVAKDDKPMRKRAIRKTTKKADDIYSDVPEKLS
jgi:predicted  nucleic acid-binding Zn-ribbon protein